MKDLENAATRVVLVMSVMALALARSDAEIYQWVGGSGDWSDSSKWDPSTGVPGAGDIAIISTGSVTVSSATMVAELQFESSTLLGEGTLTVTDALDWSSGVMTSGAGAGVTVVGPNATARLLTGTERRLDRRTLVVEGILEHVGSGPLRFSNAADVEIALGGVVDFQTDTTWNAHSGAPSTMSNAGTIRKSGGNGETALWHPRPVNEATGRMEVLSGTLSFPVGLSGGGVLHAGVGAEVVVANSSELADVEFTGAGVTRFTAGTLTLSGSCSSDNVVLAGSDLSGTHTLTGDWEWERAQWKGEGTTTIAAGGTVTLTGSVERIINAHTVVVEGVLEHAGSATLRFANASQFEVRDGGVVELQSDAVWNQHSGAPSQIVNDGTFRKSGGSGTSLISSVNVTNNNVFEVSSGSMAVSGSTFMNDGVVRATSTGNLNLSVSGASMGAWEVADGATVIFSSGSPRVGQGSTFTGAGAWRVSGADLGVEGEVSIPRLELVSGTLSGEGTLTVTDTLDWSSGVMTSGEGGGVTVVGPNATARLLTGTERRLDRRTLVVEGTLEHVGSGPLRFSNAADVEIVLGGVVDFQTDTTWNAHSGAPSTMTNAGTIRKSGGNGETALWHPRPVNEDTSRMEVLSGTLSFPVGLSGGGVLHAGVGAEVVVANSSELADVEFTGAGVTRFTAGTLTLSGSCSSDNVVLAGSELSGTHTLTGDWEWQRAQWKGEGTTTIAAGGTVTLTGSAERIINGHSVVVEGVFEHAGSATLRFANASQFEVRDGGVVELQSDAVWNQHSGAPSQIVNDGTFRKSGGSGTSLISSVNVTNNNVFEVSSGSMAVSGSTFMNDGVVRAASTGSLNLSVSGASMGAWEVADGATVIFSSGSPRVGQGSTFTGAGAWRVSGADLGVEGEVSIPRLELVSGTLSGEGTLTVTDTLDWSSGVMTSGEGGGVTVVGPNATARLLTGTERRLDRRTLVVEGTLEHVGSGPLRFSNAADVEIVLGGVVDFQTDTTWNAHSGAPSTMTNAGTIRKSGGNGETALWHPRPVNEDTSRMEVLSGTLSFPVGLSGGGVLHAGVGAEVVVANSSELADVEFTGAGVTRFTAGTLTLSGSCSSDNVVLAGSELSGTHTLTGDWEWQRAQWKGEGTTTIAAGGTVTLTGSAERIINGHSVVVEGVFEHAGSATLRFANASQFEVRDGGVVELQSDAVWNQHSGAPSQIVNGGTFRKSDGSGTSSVSSVHFRNEGTLAVNQGELHFQWAPELTAMSVLEFEMSGPNHPGEYGQLTSDQVLDLNGELSVQFSGDWAPNEDDEFVLIPSPTSGDFASYRTSFFPGDLYPDLEVSEAGVGILVVSPFSTRILRIAGDPDGTMRVLVSGVVNLSYTMEESSDLRNWDPVESATMPPTSQWEFTDSDGGLAPRKFYRIVWNP